MWYCRRWFRIVCSIHWTRIICITNDSRKSHGYYFKTTRMRRTSSWCSICLHPGQNGRCTDVIENSKVRMSRYLDTSSETQSARIMVQDGRLSCSSSWTEFVRSSFGRTIVGTAIWESSIEIRLEKTFQTGSICSLTEKMTILSCVCGRHQRGWVKSRTLVRLGKFSWKTLIWENQRWARLIACMHHTCEHRQCCYVGNTTQPS